MRLMRDDVRNRIGIWKLSSFEYPWMKWLESSDLDLFEEVWICPDNCIIFILNECMLVLINLSLKVNGHIVFCNLFGDHRAIPISLSSNLTVTELSQLETLFTVLIKCDFFGQQTKTRWNRIRQAIPPRKEREFLRRIEEESDLPPRVWCINHRRGFKWGPIGAPSPSFVIKIHLPTIHGSLFLARRLWFFRRNVAGLAPLLAGTMGPAHGWLMTILER